MRKFVLVILFLMAVFACINAYSSAAAQAEEAAQSPGSSQISSN